VQPEELVAYCLTKPGAEGFAFIGLEGGTVSVKCVATPARPPSGGTATPLR
jgi:hypothetical protein